MYRQLLVTLDGTVGVEVVLPHAIAMARAMRSTITLLRVIDPVVSEWGERGTIGRSNATEAMQTSFSEQAEHYLQQVAVRLRAEGLAVETMLRQGQPARQIVDAAAQSRADAIAMATRSRRGLNRLMFGSVAEEVMHRADLPVLLVRQD